MKTIFITTVVWAGFFFTQPDNLVSAYNPTPRCNETVQGVSTGWVSYPCTCPNGSIVTNTASYAACYQLLVCWEGSLAPTQSFCPPQTQTHGNMVAPPAYQTYPGYNYYQNNYNYTGASLPYQYSNPTQMHWSGNITPSYQSYSQASNCQQYQYWDGYRCANYYYNYTSPYATSNNYNSYSYQNSFQSQGTWYGQPRGSSFGYTYRNGSFVPANEW